MKPGSKPLTSTVDLAIGLALLVAVFLVYAQAGTFDFTSYDDNLYVTENPHVQAGLALDSIKWAMTAVVAGNWMPVTLLSHMLDCQLFHLQSGMHHLTNVFLHFLSTLLLFVVLKRATGARWPSAFVAAIFALHPLHVESVAWVAERKDVLSAFFFFLALYAYVRYSEQPGVKRYLLVGAAFTLGLMAKPMLVTFPFVLLLLDVWPLRRAQFPKALIEKVPLCALSAIVSAVTFYAQRSTQAVQSYPLSVRIENALISYLVYLGQTLWPAGLAVLYPYDASPATWQAAAALIVILAISAAVLYASRTRPYLVTGWFWYLGTLVPVIGFVQVGLQARADRYMYLPMIGLLIMLAWGVSELKQPRIAAAAAALCCIVCAALAHAQTDYWQNSGTLFQRAIDVTHNNYVAEYNLGNYLMNNRLSAEAIPHFEAALRVKPDYAEAESNLGMVLGNMPNRLAEAIPHFEAAVRLRPNLLEAQYNLATALAQMGRTSEALSHYQAVEKIQPSPQLEKIIETLRAQQK
jgi:tetratricopeptide (TPR) repeat protein